MNQDRLRALLTNVQQGTLAVPDALKQMRTLPYENLGFASLDHHRTLRQGFPEVIFCEGKTVAQVLAIAKTLLRKKQCLARDAG
jgi:NCAIR mutase (PurE)-related protein